MTKPWSWPLALFKQMQKQPSTLCQTAFYIVPRQGLNHVSKTAHCEILSHYSNKFLVVNLDEVFSKKTHKKPIREIYAHYSTRSFTMDKRIVTENSAEMREASTLLKWKSFSMEQWKVKEISAEMSQGYPHKYIFYHSNKSYGSMKKKLRGI